MVVGVLIFLLCELEIVLLFDLVGNLCFTQKIYYYSKICFSPAPNFDLDFLSYFFLQLHWDNFDLPTVGHLKLIRYLDNYFGLGCLDTKYFVSYYFFVKTNFGPFEVVLPEYFGFPSC